MKTVADRHRLAAYQALLTSFPVVPTSMTLNDLEPQNRGFSEFLAILGCNTHFKSELRPKPFKIDQDNLRMKCSTLNVGLGFNGVMFDPHRFKESSIRMHQIWVSPSKCTVSATVDCWQAFRGYQHRRPWTTLNPQNMGFMWLFCYFRLRRIPRVNFHWNILEIDQDNLRTKLNWCCRASHEH